MKQRMALTVFFSVAPLAFADTTAPSYPPPTPEEVRVAFPDLGAMNMPGMDMRGRMPDMDGSALYHQVLFDRLEQRQLAGGGFQSWEAQAWWGSDSTRLRLRSEGERQAGTTLDAETGLYWQHAASAWWDSLLGLQQDGGRGPARTWLAMGVQGLSPWFFHLNATVLAGDGLRLEAEDDWVLSDRLVLQPRLELNGYGQPDPVRGIAAGFSDKRLGLRLRYEWRRDLAPYAGVEWRQGRSAEGRGAALVGGLRFWF